jgi:hypothetical protein
MKLAVEVRAMAVLDILDKAKEVLPAKADELGRVTPGAIGDALGGHLVVTESGVVLP